MTAPREVAEAWADWIAGVEWSWFFTGTFAAPGRKDGDPRGELREQARGHTAVGWHLSDRRFREWVGELQERQPLDDVWWLRSREPHQISRSTHFHALVGGVEGQSRRRAWRAWFDRNGMARIVPVAADYDTGEAVGSRIAVVRYVTKYVLKRDGEVEFSANLGRYVR